MTLLERFKIIENLLHQDPERCLSQISSNSFISSLYYPELKSLVNIFEVVLQKKTTQSKSNIEKNLLVRPQLVIGFYSVIIMRSSEVTIKQEYSSNIATKVDSQSDSVYNVKLATETLTKIYRTLNEGDPTREIICGLLLKIKGFNNYKLIAKDLTPLYISDQTMNIHFQNLKAQCPNILETQLYKYRKQWGKYLRYKPISLISFQELLSKIINLAEMPSHEEENYLLSQIEEESAYLLNRFSLLQESQLPEKLNIDELISSFDSIHQQLNEKIKETTLTAKKSVKRDHLQYDFKQEKHCHYLKVLNHLLMILNKSISSLHLNWLRKIKWLFNFVFTLFISFDIKGNNFHEAVAIQYSKVLISLLQIMTNYLMMFKSGLFPQGALVNLSLSEQYSIFKLLEAILYNEYPFDESENIKYQNYQKQRKHHDNKTKQHVIDVVNFNMKSLNINLHWDSMLIKIIPQIKNSFNFAKQLIYLCLTFLQQYFSITQNFQEAPKTLLMISNAKNSIFTTDRRANSMITTLRDGIYPQRRTIKQGIEYFCEEYFEEQLKYNQKRKDKMEEEEQASRKRRNFLELCKTDEIQISSINQANFNNLKKTESYDALLQGWENYESIRDSAKENSISNKENPMFQSVQSQNNENNEIFYSVNQSKHEKMMEVIKNQKNQVEKPEEAQKQKDDQILLPEF